MSSFIRTSTGLAIFIAGTTYTVQSEHSNYQRIVDAVKEKKWDGIPNLINRTAEVQAYVDDTSDADSELTVDVANSVVLFRGEPIRPVLTSRILDMAADGFDINPMSKFLSNLMQNPSYKAVEQLYGWMEKNGITITEDGHLLAFKRVNTDFTSFHDGVTMNAVGTYVSMPRNAVDDRSEVTCSYGLHFCSQSYLPSYQGGRGQVLLLKINPADVVAIPTDYNLAKGRASKYLVLQVLEGDARTDVEVRNVVPQPVVTVNTDVNKSNSFKLGYSHGYKDGRGKQAHGKSMNHTGVYGDLKQYIEGYEVGRKDGRAKAPNLYGSSPPAAPTIDPSVRAFLKEKLSVIVSQQVGAPPNSALLMDEQQNLITDLGFDSLDLVELSLALEDEFEFEIDEEDVDTCHTLGDVLDLIVKYVDKKPKK